MIMIKVYLTNMLKFVKSINDENMLIFGLKACKNLVTLIMS